MSPTSVQLTTGPMGLQSFKSPVLSPLNSLKSGVILADVVVMAGTRLGMQRQEMAALFELSPPDFTAAFDAKDERHAKRNRLMKIDLPMDFVRQMALLMCEQAGLAVGGPDAERHALADLLAKCAEYVRVMGVQR